MQLQPLDFMHFRERLLVVGEDTYTLLPLLYLWEGQIWVLGTNF